MHNKARQWVTRLRTLVVLSFVCYAPYYLVWRVSTFNPDAPVFSWVVWGAEVFGYLTALMHFFMVRKLSNPEPSVAIEGVRVAVFIPTYNESARLVRHTLSAAVQMDYPHETWLLDDGNRPEMASLAAELGANYLTRSDNRDAKAGNLNNALPKTDAEFIAVFDADHVPARDFLTRTLGFFRKPDLAFVQTPQEYYNLDSYQHRAGRDQRYRWTEQGLFFRVIQRGKDHYGAAYFCGSCAVLRRSALDAIGGFATGTITEDLHTSLRLHKHGFTSVYFPAPLAYGLAPDSPHAFLVQRLRWGQGAMRVWLKENIVFGRGLSLAQRVNYLASILTYFDGWQKAIFYVAPVIVLVTGVMPVAELGWTFLAHFVPFYLLCFWSFEEAGRGYGGLLRAEEYNMARFWIFIWATLSGFTKRLRFKVTPKQMTEGGTARIEILPPAVILITSLGAIAIGAWLYQTRTHLAPGAFWANVFWALVNFGLAGAVLRFARGKRHRRDEYRFPIPLPGWFSAAGLQPVFGLIEDISVDGCRLVTEAPLPQDTVLDAEIFTPAGRIPVRARIARAVAPDAKPNADRALARGARPKHVWGVRFEYAQAADSAAIERLLFGSDLQWPVMGLRDRFTTPVAWLVARLAGEPRSPVRAPEKWLSVVARSRHDAEEEVQFGVLSRTGWAHGPARMIAFKNVPVGTEMELDIFGNAPRDRIAARVLDCRRISDELSDAYELRLETRLDTATAKSASGVVTSATAGAVLLLVAAFPNDDAHAAESLLLAGAEQAADDNGYAYLGAIVPFGGSSRLGNGWVHRLWLDWLEYRYDSNGQAISAQGPGASWMIGYHGGTRLQYGLYAGVTYRDTDLDPDDPNAANRGRQVGVGVVAELNGRFGPAWNYGLIAALTEDPSGSYWTRFRLLHPLSAGPAQIGVETVVYGDQDYNGAKVGLVIEHIPIAEKTGLGIKLGANRIEGRDAGGYVGLDLAWVLGGG